LHPFFELIQRPLPDGLTLESSRQFEPLVGIVAISMKKFKAF
jgi:hypothetical protein